jgi:hypothetical protein
MRDILFYYIESDACVQSMHIVAIDNIMHTIIFITIGAGAVATPKMLPLFTINFRDLPIEDTGLKKPTVHYKNR